MRTYRTTHFPSHACMQAVSLSEVELVGAGPCSGLPSCNQVRVDNMTVTTSDSTLNADNGGSTPLNKTLGDGDTSVNLVVPTIGADPRTRSERHLRFNWVGVEPTCPRVLMPSLY